MKKKVMFMAAIILMSVFITGFRTKAAEKQDFYAIVKNGVESDIDEMKEEDSGYTVLSVKSQECVTERVCTYDVKFIDGDEQYRLWIYLNGDLDEARAVLYDSYGDVEDYSYMTLEEASQDYM